MEKEIKYEKLIYSIPEAAQVLGISTSKMYQVVNMKGFPVIALGKRRVIPIKALERWIEEQIK